MENTINVDIISNGNGTYDTWISTEGSPGAHYPDASAEKIGVHVADLVDCLEEADSGRHYLPNVSTCKGIPENDRAEFIGNIIDIFEDFLEDQGITVPNPERDEADAEDENNAIIYGSHYGEISDKIDSMIRAWDLVR